MPHVRSEVLCPSVDSKIETEEKRNVRTVYIVYRTLSLGIRVVQQVADPHLQAKGGGGGGGLLHA